MSMLLSTRVSTWVRRVSFVAVLAVLGGVGFRAGLLDGCDYFCSDMKWFWIDQDYDVQFGNYKRTNSTIIYPIFAFGDESSLETSPLCTTYGVYHNDVPFWYDEGEPFCETGWSTDDYLDSWQGKENIDPDGTFFFWGCSACDT